MEGEAGFFLDGKARSFRRLFGGPTECIRECLGNEEDGNNKYAVFQRQFHSPSVDFPILLVTIFHQQYPQFAYS